MVWYYVRTTESFWELLDIWNDVVKKTTAGDQSPEMQQPLYAEPSLGSKTPDATVPGVSAAANLRKT